jgi:D-amino-acid oxidase
MPGPAPLASYNYTPPASVYPTAAGDAGGLYLYPRTDTWVLGGSARLGTLTDAGDWKGPSLAGPTCTVDGQAIPQAVLETNAAIIRDWAGVDIRRWPMRTTYGIRYVRDPDGDGVRLDVTSAHGRRVVHCHGHGGAGVTLSWSSALRVARHLRNEGCLLPAPDCGEQPSASALPPADAMLARRLFQQIRTRLQG